MSSNWKFNLNDKTAGIPRKLAEGIQSKIFFGAQIMLSIVEFEPNSKGKMHHHPEEQWGVLLEGSCKRFQGDEVIEMKEGDFWYTPGGTPHTIVAGAEGARVLDIFSPVREEYKVAGEGFGKKSEDE